MIVVVGLLLCSLWNIVWCMWFFFVYLVNEILVISLGLMKWVLVGGWFLKVGVLVVRLFSLVFSWCSEVLLKFVLMLLV